MTQIGIEPATSCTQKSKENMVNYEENDNPLALQMNPFLLITTKSGFDFCILNRIKNLVDQKKD